MKRIRKRRGEERRNEGKKRKREKEREHRTFVAPMPRSLLHAVKMPLQKQSLSDSIFFPTSLNGSTPTDRAPVKANCDVRHSGDKEQSSPLPIFFFSSTYLRVGLSFSGSHVPI